MKKKVELTQVRAMLREIVATSGNDRSDVDAVMTLGTVESFRRLRKTQVHGIDGIVQELERAMPKMSGGATVSLEDAEWQDFEELYYQRVLRPLLS